MAVGDSYVTDNAAEFCTFCPLRRPGGGLPELQQIWFYSVLCMDGIELTPVWLEVVLEVEPPQRLGGRRSYGQSCFI